VCIKDGEILVSIGSWEDGCDGAWYMHKVGMIAVLWNKRGIGVGNSQSRGVFSFSLAFSIF
jgi:hypothetical protein